MRKYKSLLTFGITWGPIVKLPETKFNVESFFLHFNDPEKLGIDMFKYLTLKKYKPIIFVRSH